MLFQSIIWSQKPRGWVQRKSPKLQNNLLTITEVFKLETVHLCYLIFEGSTVLFDHLFEPKTRLYFALFTSITFDTFILLIIPTIILYRSKYNYIILWAARKIEVKKTKFSIISSTIEPRRDFSRTRTKAKRRKRIRNIDCRLETIEELPNIYLWIFPLILQCMIQNKSVLWPVISKMSKYVLAYLSNFGLICRKRSLWLKVYLSENAFDIFNEFISLICLKFILKIGIGF